VHELLGHLQDACVIFLVPLDARSGKRRQVTPRKSYLVDPALCPAFAYQKDLDVGHLLENVVYLHLRRQGAEIAYHLTESGREVDFIARHPDGRVELVQACAAASAPATARRELDALAEAMPERGVSESLLVTLDEEREEETEGGRVRVVPAWRWLLEGE